MMNIILIPTNTQQYFDVVLLHGVLQHIVALMWPSSGRCKQEHSYNYSSVRNTPPWKIIV